MRAVESDESQFVAVYGRRRIGKAYLVRETLGMLFGFEHSGIVQSEVTLDDLFSA